jgi:lipopolysaccharide biosynthesis regulator YciM
MGAMEPLLWLLLPVAAASGWITARLSAGNRGRSRNREGQSAFSEHCLQGLNYLLSEQSDKAINLLVDLVDVDEDTVETHLVLGSLFRRRGEVDRAIRIHQNIIARPSLSPEQKANALQQLGIDYLKAGLLDRAENIFLKLSDTGKNQEEAYRYLTSVYEQEKEWNKAVDAAVRHQKSGGASQHVRIAHYHCELVEEYVKTSKVEAAVAEAEQALLVDPDCIRAHIQAGDIQLSKGNFTAAVKRYRKALAIDRHFSPVVLNRLYKTFARAGTLHDFPAFVRENADCASDAAARYFLVRAYKDLGDEERLHALLYQEMKRDEVSPYIVLAYLEMMKEKTSGEIRTSFQSLEHTLDSRLGTYMACHCTHCGFESNLIFWQCPGCQHWGTVRPHQNPVEYSWLDS